MSAKYLVVSCPSNIDTANDIIVLGVFKSRKAAEESVIEDIKEGFMEHRYEDALDMMRDDIRFENFLRGYRDAPCGDNIETLWVQVEYLFKRPHGGFFNGWFGQSYQISKIEV